MRNFIVFFWVSVFTVSCFSQELNCKITVNSDQIGQTNQQVFKTLERSLNDFVNKTQWSTKKVAVNERINCAMLLTITSFDSNRFSGTLQVQSSRPVYNSSYQSPLLNYKDNDFSFEYVEYQPLFLNLDAFDSNLVSVISYYAYLILGIDADTFALQSGDVYYNNAQKIVNQAQAKGYKGWQQLDGNRSRFALLDNLKSNTFKEYREVLYVYHRNALDLMTQDVRLAKKQLAASLALFKPLSKRRANAYVMQVFFDAKMQEIVSVFSGGPRIDLVKTIETLNSIAPFHGSKWNAIKNQ